LKRRRFAVDNTGNIIPGSIDRGIPGLECLTDSIFSLCNEGQFKINLVNLTWGSDRALNFSPEGGCQMPIGVNAGWARIAREDKEAVIHIIVGHGVGWKSSEICGCATNTIDKHTDCMVVYCL
jgi:hypothetical protein